MANIWDLEIWEKDALMSWIFDTQKKIFDAKTTIREDFLMSIPQQTRRESHIAANRDAADRRRVILEILTEHENGMTAREVSSELHRRGITPTIERNYAAPRLTELYKAGKITTARKKICPQTGRNVAVWTVRG
jgi:hypothetical protein